ncbi:hypothetical protein JCM8547_008713 [Rhodosporidiobolus lusitaniae]
MLVRARHPLAFARTAPLLKLLPAGPTLVKGIPVHVPCSLESDKRTRMETRMRFETDLLRHRNPSSMFDDFFEDDYEPLWTGNFVDNVRADERFMSGSGRTE